MDIDFSDLENPADLTARPEKDTREKYPCVKCGGTGTFVYGYRRRIEGKCHACNGRGYFLTSPDARRKAKASRVKSKDAARKKAWSDFKEAHPELAKWMVDNMHWNSFAKDIIHTHIHDRGKVPTDNQIAALKRMMEKTEATRAAKRAAQEANSVEVDLTKVHALFGNAHASGLKKPRLRIRHLMISEAPVTGKNAGYLYVKDDGEYAGKISEAGKFYPVRSARSEIGAELAKLALDPMGEATAHGKETGQCACCGRELTNPDSIEAGIGPICAGKWGL